MNRKHRSQSVSFAWRRHLVQVMIAVAFLLLAGRAYDLQILRRDFLSLQGNARQQRVLEVPAHRGAIIDRNGEPLAISTTPKPPGSALL